MQSVSRAIGLAVFLLFPPAASLASDIPAVRVQFSLAEPVYRDQFLERDIKKLDSGMTLFLIQRLSQEIGFLRFTSDSSASFTMTFTLGEATAPKSKYHEVGIHILLTGPGATHSDAYWPFRDPQRWGDSLGELAHFETEIRDQASKHPPSDLVPKVLSLIPLASNAGSFIHLRPWFESAWILPFRHTDLCMAFQSELKIETEVSIPVGKIPRDFRAVATMRYSPTSHTPQDEELRGRLVAVPVERQDGLDMMSQSEPSAVRVKKVFVTRYLKMPVCPSRP